MHVDVTTSVILLRRLAHVQNTSWLHEEDSFATLLVGVNSVMFCLSAGKKLRAPRRLFFFN